MIPDFESLFSLFLRYGMLTLLGIFVWGVIDTAFLIKRTGKIKRGIRVWSEPLSPSMRAFLEGLTEDIVEERQLFFRKVKVGFIRVENGEAVIQYRRKYWSTSWPYVGYVDLRKVGPIEYRASLPMHLCLLPFILTIVVIPFVVLLMGVNYYMERGAILGFISKRMELTLIQKTTN
ncbi:MAG: hypothetical protein U0401_00265 [Anaerolineae bacterium]